MKVAFLFVFALLGLVECTLTIPNAISSHMVLQRQPKSARIWGRSSFPNGVVKAQLDNDVYQVFVDKNGDWEISFDPQVESVDHTIIISDQNDKIALTDVAFGDVYLCAGQSNMDYSISDSFDANTSIPDSINYPNMRLLTISRATALTPQNDSISRWPDHSNWVRSDPKYLKGPSFEWFSAVCYYFLRNIYQNVNQNGVMIPIGGIMSAYGGTLVEAWTTPAGLEVCGPVHFQTFNNGLNNSVDPRTAHIQHQPARIDAPQPSINTSSVLWNAMVYPIVKMRLAGVAFYQGESNVANATNYACRWPAMVNDWRTQFGQYDLWFGFVLLAGYREGNNPDWSNIRNAQLAALSLPYIHIASAQDLGDEASSNGGIHPRNKTLVGDRLGLGARAALYNQAVVTKAPVLSDIIWPVDEGSNQTVIVRFSPSAPENQGLLLRDTAECIYCCADIQGSAFTVITSDGVWRRAVVNVIPSAYTVTVTATNLPVGVSVVSVQQGWEDYQECALYNSANLPMLPINRSRF